MLFLGLITRCKDEFFIKEFCDYYLSQEVDKIFVIDDNSNDKSIYNNINDNKIEIIYEKNIIKNNYANKLYKQIKSNFKWMIYCDVDEFITTKKNITNTIKDELNTTFKDVDCIKIPWVMMSCNNRDKNPNSILLENTYRWNHNKKHPHKIHKFRCRYNQIEIKCIFKTDKFNSIWDHHPKENIDNIITVDGVRKKKQHLNTFYKNLRENDIENGILLCYHYRIISKENCINKLKNNLWYIQNGYTIDDLMSCDYPEIIDETLKYKIISMKRNYTNIFIHIGKSGGSFIKNLFPTIKSIHMTKPKIINNNVNYIIILRNPIERFVSAFYHSKYLIDFDTKGYDFDMLINDKTTPYYRLKNKIKNRLKNNNPFAEWKSSAYYKDLILYFESANALAESLTSDDKNLQKKARDLCNNEEIEHIYKGIGWYLHNGDFIEKNRKNIIYCQDINEINKKYLSIIMKINTCEHNYNRKNNKKYDKYLSPKAIKNIINFYKDTDYKVLQKLVEYKFITKELFEKYHYYNI